MFPFPLWRGVEATSVFAGCKCRVVSLEPVEDPCIRPLPTYIVRCLSLQPLIAAEATSFLLIEKKQKIKPEKTFSPQAILPARFSVRPLPAFALFDIVWFIYGAVVILRNKNWGTTLKVK